MNPAMRALHVMGDTPSLTAVAWGLFTRGAMRAHRSLHWYSWIWQGLPQAYNWSRRHVHTAIAACRQPKRLSLGILPIPAYFPKTLPMCRQSALRPAHLSCRHVEAVTGALAQREQLSLGTTQRLSAHVECEMRFWLQARGCSHRCHHAAQAPVLRRQQLQYCCARPI